MKSTNRVPNAKRPVAFAPAPETAISGRVIQDYDSVQAQEAAEAVELLSVCGFVNRVPYRFHMEEIMRFGSKVGAAAEALQLSYLTRVDRSLGPVRVFPVSLMMRVYQVMAAQQGWPQVVDVAVIEDKGQEPVKANERTKKHLQNVSETIENPMIASAMTTVLNWLDGETERMKSPAPPVTPLRTV